MEMETPVSYQKFKFRTTKRQLWPQNEISVDSFENRINRDSVTLDPWDKIEAPHFIDFFNVPETSDSFFDKKEERKQSLKQNEKARIFPTSDTLVELLDSFTLKPLEENCVKDKEYKEKEGGENLAKPRIETKDEIKREEETYTSCKRHALTKPSTLYSRDKYNKQEKEDGIIVSVPSKSGHTNSCIKLAKSNHENDTNESSKQCTEVWKKTPFIPRPPMRILKRPKAPLLLTKIRAEERKRYEERLKEKEKNMEMLKSLAAVEEKKREKAEIIRLRKATVHKAQPIRRYKLNFPQIEKRPLTEPLTPFNHKRRRRV